MGARKSGGAKAPSQIAFIKSVDRLADAVLFAPIKKELNFAHRIRLVRPHDAVVLQHTENFLCNAPSLKR